MTASPPRKITTMGKYKEAARYNVISMRVSDDEKAQLDALTLQSRKSISRLMREAIEMYARQTQKISGRETGRLRMERPGDQGPETVAMAPEM